MSDYKGLDIEVDDNEIENLIRDINNLEEETYDSDNLKYKPKAKSRGLRRLFKKKHIIGLVLIVAVCYGISKLINSPHSGSGSNNVSGLIIDPLTGLMLTKGEPRIDKKTGLDLNKYIIDGMYHVGVDNIPIKKVEHWSLHTPQCPNLQPIKYNEKITNPKCEETSLQFVNLSSDSGKGIPYSLPLHDISNLIDKYDDLDDDDKIVGELPISQQLDESYHPYDYGFDGNFDKTKGRRLYSFISFDFEFDLLDVYLAENYEVVDYFVIFESNTTFVGQPKPLYFTKTLLESKRYNQFKDKLIPLPYLMPEKNNNSMELNVINLMVEEGLKAVQAKHGDLFVYGKVGEIPKPHVLSRLKNCGGWEHLYSNSVGGDADKRAKPLAFSSWAYGYSIERVEDSEIGKAVYPNLAIFDDRRSITEDNKRDSSKFDPYKGYSNFNLLRNATLSTTTSAILWSAGWDMTKFLPTINHYYNKLVGISSESSKKDEYKVKSEINTKINNEQDIFSKEEKKYVDNLHYKTPPVNGVPYNFDYKYWKEQTADPSNLQQDFSRLYDKIKLEIPNSIGRYSICYNYMFERKFGINNTLWYDAVPRENWETVDFEKLDYQNVRIKIIPRVHCGDFEDLHILSAEETVRDIIKYRKSISRFGDGEYSLAIKNHYRSEFQKDDERLGDKLKDILFSEDERFLLGIPENFLQKFFVLRNDQNFWKKYTTNNAPQLLDIHSKNRVYGSSMMSRYYVTLKDKSHVGDYIKVLKLLWEDKDVLLIEGVTTRFGVGNDLLDNAKSVQRILCPPKSAFDAFDKIYNEALKHDTNKTVLLSLGQTATALAYDLFKAGYQAIDMGHADIEYEWFLRKTENGRVKIENKFVNEAGEEGRISADDNFHDEKYESEIVARITIDDEQK